VIILVTVGTTAFDSLIQAVDQHFSTSNKLILQIANGQYEPVNHQYFRYSDDIDHYYKNADLIISHGGAGSVFRILDLTKKLIIVPNLERLDSHQLDICQYMKHNNHATVCENHDDLADLVVKVKQINFTPYQADEFTGGAQIRDYLGLNS